MRWFLSAVFATLLALLASFASVVSPSPAKPLVQTATSLSPPSPELTSSYLNEPVAGARIIRLRGAGLSAPDGGEIEVQFDTNVCSLDEFGDPAECTLKDVPWQKARLVPRRESPGARRVFDLRGVAGDRLRLVLTPIGRQRMLVIDAGGRVERVVPLDSSP